MLNNIISFKQYITNLTSKFNRTSIIVLTASSIMALAATSVGLVRAYANDGYKTDITFDQNQATLLVLNDRKVEIKPGLAVSDIDKLNNERDPEAIKAYIQQKGAEYDVDWKLVYAIGAYESGYFKSNLAVNNNNFFGRKATSSTWMNWETPQAGIDNQFVYLKTRYIDKGMDTPAEMNHVYCEGNTWQFKVQSIMNEV
jgi:hypothetical protein